MIKALHFGLPLLLFALAHPSQAQNVSSAPVSGLAPHERPANAPRIAISPPLDKARALQGISDPKPASLKFLGDQGGWYTPFVHPGMTPPYDPRGWHARPAPSAK